MENGNNACPQSKGIDETVLHSAICRGLSKSIPDASDVKSFIRMQIAYTTSEDAALVKCRTLENAIREIQEKADEAEEMCIITEGNKQPYMEEIKNIMPL